MSNKKDEKEIKKNKIERNKKIIDSVKDNRKTIISVILILQVALIPIKSYLLPFILIMGMLASFVIMKDFLDEKEKKKVFNLAKLSAIIFVNSEILTFFMKINENVSIKGKSVIPVALMFCFASTLSFIALLFSENTKKKLDELYENPILEKLGIETGADELKPGDVRLCLNLEKNKDEVLKYKDRFLHMLILGATGTGKTSQVILPMINQDLQVQENGITVLEPKADLAEKVHLMAKHYGRKSIYFNPVIDDCPYFNPLYGNEEDVIENMATTFRKLSADSPQFFLDMNETLLRNSLKVLKRTLGNRATFVDLSRLISNLQGYGTNIIKDFSRMGAISPDIAGENADIASWFMNEYFNERSKTNEHCSALRSQVSKIVSNKHLRKVLNPPNGENDVDFEKHLAEGGVLAIATAQGDLGALGRYLGFFIMLNLQSAVLKRPGSEDTRLPHYLYIDEFQVYANSGFADMLTQGRSYRVASHLATQNRALIGMGGGQEGKDFIELVSTNARNVIIFPGANSVDAKYYSDEFGEVTEVKEMRGISKAKFNPLYGFNKMSYPNESIREQEVTEARYSASDIIFKEFEHITYRIIRNNSVQRAYVGKINYIPYELNKMLDAQIEEMREERERKKNIEEAELQRLRDNLMNKNNANGEVAKNNALQDYVNNSRKNIVNRDTDYTDDFVVKKDDDNIGSLVGDLSEVDDLI